MASLFDGKSVAPDTSCFGNPSTWPRHGPQMVANGYQWFAMMPK